MKKLFPLLLCIVTTLPCFGATLENVTLPDTVTVGSNNLVLNGIGLRRKFVIKVYVGGLYLEKKEKDPAAVLRANKPRRMVFHYLYDVSKDQMCEMWQDGLADNTPSATGEVKQAFAKLCSWMDGMGKNKMLTLTYVPDEGTSVELNGQRKGVLPGKATADAILSIWLGANAAPGRDFKKAVLGD